MDYCLIFALVAEVLNNISAKMIIDVIGYLKTKIKANAAPFQDR